MSESIPTALTNYMHGLATHDIALIGSTFADEIRFVTPAKTMEKAQILAFLTALYRGFPDWHYDHDEPEPQPDGSIAVVWRQGGTHTGTLAFPGFDPVPATGRTVTIPEHPFFYRVTDAGLTEIRPQPVPGGAPRGDDARLDTLRKDTKLFGGHAETWGWADPRTIGAIVGGLVLLGLFVLETSRAVSPAIDLSLFAVPRFRWANLGILLYMTAFGNMFFGWILFAGLMTDIFL